MHGARQAGRGTGGGALAHSDTYGAPAGGPRVIPTAWPVAFSAGVASFISPCMWPLYPAYLTYLAGTPGATPRSRLMLARATLFLLGFGLVFIALGATASEIGQALAAYQVALRKVSGLLIAGFGLAMAGLLPYWLLGTDRRLAYRPARPSGLGAVALGAAFAFGWTPCVGPVLAAILLLTSVQASLSGGVALLLAYTAGFAVPFLLVAAFLGQAKGLLRRLTPAVPWIARASGLLLVALGALVYTNELSAISWTLYTHLTAR